VALPLYAIEREGSQAFVNKLVEGKLQKMPVELGLSGSNGMVEVLSGVSEGDIVEY
jgi:multidrug efflux pump subunit AcrA (membrane-fusion protein)